MLRFGAIPTSKPLLQYLQRHADRRQILVDGDGGWRDPLLLASDVVHADARAFCEALGQPPPAPPIPGGRTNGARGGGRGRAPLAPTSPGGRARDAAGGRAAVADVFARGGSVGPASSPPGSGGAAPTVWLDAIYGVAVAIGFPELLVTLLK